MAFLQHYWTAPLRLLIRFGRWDEILASPAPPDDLPYARAMWHDARGRALAARGDVQAAEAELARLQATAASPDLAAMELDSNSAPAILDIATNVLAGEIPDLPPGHTGVAEEDTEFLEISPPGRHQQFVDAARRNLAAM